MSIPSPMPRQIVDWMGGYFGMRAAERKERIDMLIERFDLVPHANKPFRELSGGLKRRVILARAMVNDPKLLILDEPTAGVDVELRLDLWRYLQELNRDGTTILLTSHYLEEVERLCRTIAIVDKGRIVREGTKEEIVTEPGGWSAPIWRRPARRPIMSRRVSRRRCASTGSGCGPWSGARCRA